ncbi:MAG: hypothetical protein M3O15_14675, partial [Acidobacteriota bacterium]|nr:hypothetical protein [Acidobacteriota bacterium]
MFIGRFGAGLAGKAARPGVSLGTWFLSVQLVDLLWPLLLLFGWEHVRVAPGATSLAPFDFYDYPLTHSLAGAFVWSLLFAAAYIWLGRVPAAERVSTALLLGAGVLSHWVLDFLVHRPLSLWCPAGRKFGLGPWNSPTAEILLELAIYLLGIALYLHATRARDAARRHGLWPLLLLLPGLWLAPLLPATAQPSGGSLGRPLRLALRRMGLLGR